MVRISGIQVIADTLAKMQADDLEKVKEALVREEAIRHVMAETGESREIVVEMADAVDSMGQEVVLELTDGEPTTLRDALNRYIDRLEAEVTDDPNDEEAGRGSRFGEVARELTTLLNYPWSGDEERLALHQDNRSLRLEVEYPDDEHIRVVIGDNRHEVYSGSYDLLGRSGMDAVENVAQAVYRAVLERVIADREHTVHLNSASRWSLLEWLKWPNGGSWSPKGEDARARVSFNAVEGGGLLVRTRPYRFQLMPRLHERG